MRIAVLGSGRIGTAVVKSLISCGYSDIVATGRRDETLSNAKSLGAHVTRDNDLAVKSSDVIFVTVKPYHFPALAKQVNRSSWVGKIIVSFMAGVRINTIKLIVGNSHVYRAMPNMNALVGLSSTAVAVDQEYDSKGLVEKLLKCMGRVYWVPEELLDAWTALAGSGPAFIAEIVDALVMSGVLVGLPRDLACDAVLDVLEGTARFLRNNDIHPAILRDEVTTPAGTTIRGLITMESEGVKAALMKTIEASYKRSMEIGREIDDNVRRELGL
ncbi:pyrroline-5-carboxylate reductase [Desulfurococcus mucosus]|uniref:Pyrroline-5-carboxylate reductase n=1 Tax=Desulfurococcus mucosus (strain ATCC 35584 / DSM 2162 / JCM 9187 / O7/1) TaxID=765177 RepID=E8R934_DESM0|nr:pyrroline-5-carboxylate reductase [Desulfurococcus mucosus]ADV65010.1 pyrroline-5-carboxylate reductase [Desulfurococcus mucosus DSM 2162]